ncbi:DNA polymerase III subunit beta [Aurantimonas sp. 22II-16-19i]|uniref:DNA polymerase III subunit beta n=1 Tax=Aurantimonas sp. 22II-16-19i TaxID=1317114 RepID=UPI0009F7D49B|nr:DNA polymerase III subunit beta [Aurantimonas sp. 22II-16-19i]ORE92819.1 DNA polymerase III subunit beta [Aurantimonas sp. 22II-16-19i]
MRIIIERSNLLKSLSHVHRVVERRTTIPILSNVLVRTEDGGMRLKATDLDIEITESVAAMGEEPGATTVPAHLLYDIVRKLPEGSEVKLATNGEGTQMTVSSGRSNFRLQCLPEADFPDITAGSLSHSFQLKASDLLRLIERTQFAISTEETRYYLNGIYLHTVEAEGDLSLRAVATDGHRLARAEVKAPSGSEGMPGIIVPRKTVGEVQKLLGDCGDDDTVAVELSDAKIRFTIGAVVMTSKLIDGTFPDYQRVIPQNNDKALTLDRQTFSNAVDRVSTISSERGRAVKLSLSPDQLTLTVNSPDSGTATEELAVEYGSDDIEIGFNARYLLDITSQLSGESAVFMLADPGSPTLIRDGGDETTLYVLMPMRV